MSWASADRATILVVGTEILAAIRDPEGRSVVLLERVWTQKIARDHPEMAHHRDDVLRTVQEPDHRTPDPRDDRLRYYRRHVGPTRWMLVVVSYEQVPARIITALGTRKDPHSWSA